MKTWSRYSWQDFKRTQSPHWYSDAVLEDSISQLSQLPALVFAGETRSLINDLKEVSQGRAFLLQCGNCAENFADCNGPKIHNFIRILLQMSIIISFIGNKKVVKVGRIAGQYAKPRSSETEQINGISLPVYKGDMVNSFESDPEKRKHDPARMIDGYFRSAATLNLIRAFTKGGYASLDQIRDWQRHYFSDYPIMEKYQTVASELISAINFIKTLKLDVNNTVFSEVDLYTSHEALLLEYEAAMTRVDTTTGLYYDTSAHMVWVGERTRQPDGAHIEFLRGVNNPVGMKVGPDYDIDNILNNIQRLNPDNLPGKVCLIVRFGIKKVEKLLTSLIHAVRKHGLQVVWICDPMHGNTYVSGTGKKARKLDDILEEIGIFFQVHKSEGSMAGGVHLELTGDNVTECIGGKSNISESDLNSNYTSTCDPRLNAEQSVELAFFVAQLLRKSLCPEVGVNG